MRVLLRKSPLHKKHFFMWRKTVISSAARGTSTLKSLLSQAFSAPHVHPRPRKRPPRCTLDCGSKTPESPALRGFVAGLRALATAALYLVLKSNGFHHPENRLKKFEFLLKITSTNIVQKLPPQRCSKPLLIAFFNFSHKWLTFAFTDESGYTLGFRRKIAHNGLHAETGAFPPPATAGLCVASEIVPITTFATLDSATLLYTYISRFSVTPHLSAEEKYPAKLPSQLCSKPFLIPVFNFSHKRHTFAFTSESGHTLGSRRKIAHNGSHGETRGVSDGGAITTLGAFHTFTNIPGPGVRTANFAAFGSWPGVLSKNAESLRNSDALMRVAVPRCRGPAGLRDPVSALWIMW